MNLSSDQIFDTLIIFVLMSIVFLPLERLFSIHRQPVLRKEWKTDLLFFLGQYLLWTTPVVACLIVLRDGVALYASTELKVSFAQLPYIAQAVLAVLISDFCIYWGHRFSHDIPFLWRFHKVHHTSVRLDWLAAYREHPFDNLYTRTIENLPLFLLGFPIETISGFVVFRSIWGMFIHSNVKLNIGILKYVLGSSRLHHWHHSTENKNCNYANLMPIMDKLFGTYYDPGHDVDSYGIDETIPHGYIDQLYRPLTIRGLSQRSHNALESTEAGLKEPRLTKSSLNSLST